MRQLVRALAALPLLLIGAGCSSAQPAAVVPIATSSTIPGGVTLADVAKHATAADCWLAIDGKVYNVTSFIPNHPGGEAILRGCGKDASDMFNSRHGERAKALLPSFYIGDLK